MREPLAGGAEMLAELEDFVEFWRHLELDAPPFMHPADRPYLKGREFEFSLIPLPVVGSLERAEILVLMLNPGLSPLDRAWEARPDFRDALRGNVHQQADSEYPLIYLDPRFSDHPGAAYWIGGGAPRADGRRRMQKLRKLVAEFARLEGISFEEARACAAQRIAILQLVPYHSRSFHEHSLIDELPSCRHARAVAHAATRGKLVVAARSVVHWGFFEPVESERLVVYPSAFGASASLSPQSSGGRAILRVLQSSLRRTAG